LKCSLTSSCSSVEELIHCHKRRRREEEEEEEEECDSQWVQMLLLQRRD
jgi:hypothetical protein